MKNMVYAFVSLHNEVGYIGKAENLRDRQLGHEHRAEALRRGYSWLYVHWQGLYDPIDYNAAEVSLIRAYNPPLNVRHNDLAWLFKD